MRVGIVSDSPAVTTGFGIVTDQCCRALLARGHEVVCFGFKDRQESPERLSYPCPIWPIDSFSSWHPMLREFVSASSLDVLLVYVDIFNLEEVMLALGEITLPRLAAYAIFDGLPAYTRLLDHLRRFHRIVVTTQVAADYVRAAGLPVHGVAPPGVCRETFQPLDRAALRAQAQLDGRFVLGAFGRNTERKQQPRLLQALRVLRQSGEANGLCLYLHCARQGYWDLSDLAQRWGISDLLYFADDLEDETRGVPYRRYQPGDQRAQSSIPGHLGYVERLNLCDLVLNVPHSGDFEQVLIEAQACRVAVAATDDAGTMRAALGPGLPLAAGAYAMGKAGQQLHFVQIDAIAEAIRTLRADDTRRIRLAEAGLAYAKRHGWEPLHEAIVRMVVDAASF
jgi:glycosyltransferase involved in cell wall biosynthesis